MSQAVMCFGAFMVLGFDDTIHLAVERHEPAAAICQVLMGFAVGVRTVGLHELLDGLTLSANAFPAGAGDGHVINVNF